jgi:methionine aminotransferase
MHLTSKLPNSGTTIFAIMSKMATDYDAINLSQGFPDFPISSELIDSVTQAMQQGMNQYPPMQGLPNLRSAIANKLQHTLAIDVDPDLEITVTAGATQALYAAITALVHEGDEVILFDPAYDSYDPVIRLNKARPVHIPLTTPDFSIDWDLVEAKITSKTRCLITNSPHNPSGAIFSAEDMARLELILEKYDLLLISDEVYEHIIFDGATHLSALMYPNIRSRSIAIFSFGKTFHATGWKIGYMVAPKEITVELRKVHQFNVFTVNTPMQQGLAGYLENPAHYEGLPAFYQQKRDYFADLMKESRFTPVPTSGTYFQLYSYEKISDKHDVEVANWLTQEHKVALIPCSVFYENGEEIKFLRFCFAKREETLSRAAERLCKI